MTLIVSVGNPHFVAQLSDRRLTSLGVGSPRLVTDESNKATVWELPAGRFLIGYTGITSEDIRLNAQFIVNELLLNLAPKHEYDAGATIEALANALSKTIASRFANIRQGDRHLTVMFTGLLDGPIGGVAIPVQALVTNFQVWGERDDIDAWPSFEATLFSPRSEVDWPTLVQRVGAWGVVTESEAEALRDLLAPGKPPKAVVGKMVSLLPAWSNRSGGTVGRQAHSLVITADRSRQPIEKYHSQTDSTSFYGTSKLITTPAISVVIADLKLEVVE